MASGAVHLPLANHVHGFDAGDENAGTPEWLEAQHRPGDPLDGPVVLFDDVVEVFVLTHQDVDTGVSLDTFNGCGVGATLVDGDLFWQVVQVDGAFQKSAGSSHISLGSEKKVHRIASAVNHPVKVLPLAGHFDVGLVHPPTLANGVLAPTKYGGQHRHHLDRPAVHCGVVHENTALLHHFFNVTQTQRIGHIPAHACEHHFQGIVEPFEDLAQGAVD